MEKIINEKQQGNSLVLEPKSGNGKKLMIESYGCQMNFSDSEIVASILATEGFNTPQQMDEADLNAANAELVVRVNAEGTIYLTHTKLDDVFTIRLAVGQRATKREHVVAAWEILQKMAGENQSG